MKPHKHAAFIKSWADGAHVERRVYDGNWETFDDSVHVWATADKWEYRIKQQPKPDVFYYGTFEDATQGNYLLECCFTLEKDNSDQIKITFDGETGKLKSAEVLK